MTDYSDEERDTVRTAAFGAMMLVSKADPGFFAMFKESIAGSKVLSKASPELRELLTSGGMPSTPKGSPEEVDQAVLTSLGQAVTILQQKGPDEVEGFKSLIVDACDKVAEASKGVAPAETEAIGKVKSALGVGGRVAGPGGQVL
ncbi:hypothetical protein [Mycolicibacterium sp. XJ870]